MLVTGAEARGVVARIALVSAVACNDGPSAPVGAEDGVYVRVPAESLFVGRTMRAVAVALSPDSAAVAWPAFEWMSSDTLIAVVDSAGRVLGRATGSARISARLGSWTDFRDIRVVLQRVDGGVAFESASPEFGLHCALTATGTAYCLAASAGDSVPLYRPLGGAESISLTDLHATSTHQCGTTANNRMFCWGTNNIGQFLTGTNSPFMATVAPALAGNGAQFTAVTVGSSQGTGYTCAARKEDDVVICAGYNASRQLGRNTTIIQDPVPAPVIGDLRARQLATQRSYTCALEPGGTAYCWGSGLGSSGAAPRLVSTVRFASLSAGVNHACAVTPQGAAYCWGANGSGQLGASDEGLAIGGSASSVSSTERFRTILAGDAFTCGVTLDDALFCWGAFPPKAVSSRLGAEGRVPYRIEPGLQVRDVSADASRLCVITVQGPVFCF